MHDSEVTQTNLE